MCPPVDIDIDGPEAVCTGSIQMYCVVPQLPGSDFSWTVGIGGAIIGPDDESCVMIEWVGNAGTTEQISVSENNGAECLVFNPLDVKMGTNAAEMACLSFINTSLSGVCEVHVTPEMLLTSPVDPLVAYDIILMDEGGNIIPGDVITNAQAGQEVVAKIMDVCTGNSCWSTITVEDKMAPTIECVDTIVNCLFMGEYPGPIIWDNCTNVTVTLLNETETTYQCDPEYTHQIVRTYIAEDEYGNVSPECEQTILVSRIELDSNIVSFTGDFDASNWVTIVEGNGFVDTGGAPNSVALTSSDNGIFSQDHGNDWCIEIPYETSLQFTWNYTSYNSSPFWDPFGYRVNGEFFQLTNDNGGLIQQGNHTLHLEAGDTFCFSQETVDAIFGAAVTIVSGFTFDLYAGNIDFPEDFSVENENALTCNGYETDEDGHPAVSVTGVPVIDGVEIYPNSDEYCNLGVGYTDIEIPGTDCVKKIMRQWTVFEWWCSLGEIRQYNQLIQIADQEDPEIVCPDAINLPTNGQTCSAVFIPGLPQVSDDCSELMEIDLAYPGGFINDFKGNEAIELAAGTHELVYTVYDACLNSSSCSSYVYISDVTPPNAICDLNTSISLNTDGYAYAYANVFDDGSYDDCGPVSFQVIRMDSGNPCGFGNYTFGDFVEFCCADVGNIVNVILQVTDAEQNINQCMVNVEVQDKNPPTIVCPQDVTIACGYDFDLEDLSEFGQATASDNCMIGDIEESVFTNINDCNVGYIQRVFSVSDANGSANCIQTITIINETPFDGNTIVWPLDYVTDESCNVDGLLPDDLDAPYNYPIIFEDGCDMVATNYNDLVFPVEDENNSCFKIIRSWTVMDMCQPVMGGFATWYYDQIIMVVNYVDPVIETSCNDLEACTNENDCDSGFITLISEASDDCTPDNQMQWSYAIDFDENGSYDITNQGSGNIIDASGDYPLGDHAVLYSFEDKCGNVTTCTQHFSIIDCNGPTASCLQGVSVAIEPMDLDGDGIPDTEMACLHASVFNASSSHPCNVPLTFSYSEDINDTLLCVECCDLGIIDIELWVTDLYGNNDFCTTTLEVQDNNEFDFCPNGLDCITWGDDILVDYVTDDLLPETIGGSPVIDEDCDLQNYTVDYSDTDISNPDDACTTIERVWEVHFICGLDGVGYTHQDTQIITQLNGSDPVLECPADITVNGDEPDCDEYVIVPEPTHGPCSFGVTYTNDSPYADSPVGAASGNYPIGTTTVTYTGTDASGNSGTCTVDVTVLDASVPVAICMDHLLILDGNGNGSIVPADVDGGSYDECSSLILYEVTPNIFDCDDLGVNPVVLTVTDENGNTDSCIAQVTVVDTISPVCVMQDLFITLQDGNPVNIPGDAYDDGSFDPCGTLVSFTADQTNWDCSHIGVNVVTITLTDDNGNTTECMATLTIDDNVPPTCVPQDITVTLGPNDLVVIVPSDVDGGSFDGCGMIINYEINIDTFTCDDIGDNIVTLTLTDNGGNQSSCDATVTVIPAPELFCVANDLTVYLDDMGTVSILPEDIDGGSGGSCGVEVEIFVDPSSFDCADIGNNIVTLTVEDNAGNVTTCEATVTVLDTLIPSITCPADAMVTCDTDVSDLSQFGVPVAADNCSIDSISEIVVESLNNCGVGIITRTFTAFDPSGNVVSCVQVINVGSMEDIMTESDINWPSATVQSFECVSADSLQIFGEALVNPPNPACANFSVNYSDIDLNPNSICPDSIQRTWTVIDSCEFDATGAGVFDFVQLLIVSDTTAPVINAPDTVFVECDSLLEYIVEVSDCNLDTVFNDSPFAFDNSGPDISGMYPDDTIPVTITAIDICGNVKTQVVWVGTGPDITPPFFDCMKIIVNLDDNGEVTVNVEDLFVSGHDNCTDSIDLILVFMDFWEEGGPLGDTFPSITFTCMDTGENVVYLALIDEAGNFAPCISIITVLDPLNACGNNIMGLVSGDIYTEQKLGIEDVQMELQGPDNMYYANGDAYGAYAFIPLEFNSGYHLLTPYKQGYPLDGVSTLDIVYIQQHIMGLNALGSPYKHIAADVNQSGSITSADILELKKLILGIYGEFKKGNNWRFVDADYIFTDPSDPLKEYFPENYEIWKFEQNIHKDFIGVKLGDVNDSYTNDLNPDAESRSEIYLNVLDGYVQRFSNVEMIFTSSEQKIIAGYQLEIPLPIASIQSISDIAGVLSENDYFYDGKTLRISRVFNAPQNMDADSEFITLQVQLNHEGLISELISEERSDNFSELYTDQLDAEKIKLMFRKDESSLRRSVLKQNVPNPWSNTTKIDFELSEASHVIFRFTDAQGKFLAKIEGDYAVGAHSILLSDKMFDHYGLIITEMITEKERLTNRMVLIR